MELHDVQNGEFQNDSAAVFSPPHQDWIGKYMRFFKFRFHFIAIPVGIIIAAIHLKFGIEYLGECTIQPMINVYMIVHAAVALFAIMTVLIGVFTVRCIDSRVEIKNNKMIARRLMIVILIFQLIVALFSLSWLIAGSVWIFGAAANGVQGSDPTDTTTYCQSTLYRAAFVLIIINYVLISLIIVAIIVGYIFWRTKHTIPPLFGTMNRL
jgi:hypothetical protein